MAGYWGTPLPRKLGMEAGSRVALVGAPAGFASRLGAPAGADVRADLRGTRPFDVILRAGLVDNKGCAIDDTWSGLRFVYRRVDRPRPAR
jgi:hypothetical protein